ncbi:phospholipase A2 A2-actitoxin-Cgg2a-like [Pocillopora damicornis]|uniref:phospholipase A2 A2-actitoxin-Cgg2a-like n=1 Tax=Pocillopora damicornis TaxID=46731 RepID=UPI000F552317|nr:phospholipase A2 A2-actitoxin-Cgg2a-like [Pocillopora damicornis]
MPRNEESANATKRGGISFGLMILRVTKRNPIDFNGYGCWCGIGGKGKPEDDLDRCCLSPDQCYDKLKLNNVCPFEKGIYSLPYSTKSHHPTECEPASYYWLSGECRFRLCKCDAAAAKCFKKNRYQEKYRKYPQNKCTNDKPSKSDDETTQTLFPL